MDQQWRQLDIDDAGRIDLRQFLQALSLEHIYDQEQAHKQAEAKEAKSVNAAREGAAMDNRAAQVGKKRNSKGKESDQALRQVVSSEVDNILDTISGDSAGAPAGDGAAGEDGAGDSAVRKPSGGNNKKKQSKGKLLSREEVSKEGNGAGPGAGGGTPSKEKKEKQARTPRTPKTPGGGGANGDGGDTPGGSVGGPSVDLATASRQFAQAMKAFAGGDIREGFATLDADNDGTISRTEFKIALVTLGIAMNDADRKRLRKAMDTNNDTKLPFEEVDAYVARHSGKGGEGGVVVGEDGVGATGSAVKAPAVEKQKKEKPKSPKKLPPMVKLQPLSLPGAGSGLSLPSPLSGAGSPVGSLGASMGSAASLGGTGTSLSSPATFEQQSVNNLTGT
jgi:Ca2+-binding EF-hand superfamily protein